MRARASGSVKQLFVKYWWFGLITLPVSTRMESGAAYALVQEYGNIFSWTGRAVQWRPLRKVSLLGGVVAPSLGREGFPWGSLQTAPWIRCSSRLWLPQTQGERGRKGNFFPCLRNITLIFLFAFAAVPSWQFHIAMGCLSVLHTHRHTLTQREYLLTTTIWGKTVRFCAEKFFR